MTDLHEITIRAASPDNERQIRRIIELFHSAYGSSYPSPCVYDPLFWKNHIGARFVSLLAYSGDQLIGHLALQPDRQHPSQVQVAHPAYAETLQGGPLPLGRAYWKMIARMAERQRWELLYLYSFSSLPGLQQIVTNIFGAEIVAICPSYFTPEAFTDFRSVMEQEERSKAARNTISIAVRSLHDQPDPKPKRKLHIPAEHLEICQYLYRSFGDNHEFITSSSSHDWTAQALPVDVRAVENQHFRRVGVHRRFVHPSLLHEFSDVWTDSSRADFMFVSLNDPACPPFCSYIEERGYQFAGLLPLLRGKESIVYFNQEKGPVSSTDFIGERAQTLARYINSGEFIPPQNGHAMTSDGVSLLTDSSIS